MERKHVKDFNQFLVEQGVELGPEGPEEGVDTEGGAEQQPAQVQRLKVAFVPTDKSGTPIHKNKTVELTVYMIYYDKVKAWADKFLPKNKVEDFINILKAKHKADTLEEKKYVLDFMDEVKEKRIGDTEGSVEVEFTNDGEPITDKLDVALIYYDNKRKEKF